MTKTSSEATSLNVSSSDEESFPITNSQKCVATTSKPTASKKAAVVEADPESEYSDSESETLVATKKAKVRKEKDSGIIKEAVVSKPSTPAKRVAIVSADEPSAKKGKNSGLFQKLWTDEDEITVLKAMVDYRAEKGVYALSDSKDFYAFVKEALLGDFDRKQLIGKVRKLKDKYKTLSGKKTLTPHEEKVRKISKLIWGANSDTSTRKAKSVKKAAAVSNGDVKEASPTVGLEKEQVDADDNENNNVSKTEKEWKFIGKKSIAMGLDADLVNAGLERCSDAVKAEIEEEWEAFHLEEAALFQKKLDLVLKESNRILQALKK